MIHTVFRSSRLLPISALALTLCAPLAHADVVVDPAPPAALPDSGHAAPIRALTYAPDGQTVWSVDRTGELLVRSRDGKTTLFRQQMANDVNSLRVLSDGSLLAGRGVGIVFHFAAPQAGQPLELKRYFVTPTDAQQPTENPPFYQLDLGNWALSPDEKRLAIVTLETAREPDGTGTRGKAGQLSARVRLWDLDSNKAPLEVTVIAEVRPKSGPRSPFSPLLAWQNAQTLVVASEVSTQSFSAQSGEKTGEWKPSAQAATPDDPAAALAADEAEQLRRIDKLPFTLQERARRLMERRKNQPPDPNAAPDMGTLAGLSPDATYLLATTRAGLQRWNTRDSSVVTLENTARRSADEVAFSPDGKRIAVRAGSGLRSWDINGDKGLSYFGGPDLSDIAWTPDSSQIAAGDLNAQVRVWDANAPAERGVTPPIATLPGYFNPWNFLQSAGDTLLAATNEDVALIQSNGAPHWLSGKPTKAPVALPAETNFDIKALALAPDGKSWAETVSIRSYTGTMSNQDIPRSEVRVRAVEDGAILWRVSDLNSTGRIESLAFTPDGTLLTGKEGAGRSARPLDESLTGLHAFNGATGAPVELNIDWGEARSGYGYPSSVSEITAAPGGQTAAFANGNRAIIADLKTRQRIGHIAMNAQDWNGNAAISPDGNFLAGQIYNAFGLYDLRNEDKTYGNRMTTRLDIGEPARAAAVAYASDGKLALALGDGRVLVWAPNPEKDAKPQWETAKGRTVNALSWSADGQTLRTADARGELKWRDGNNGQLQKTLRLTPFPDGVAHNHSWLQWNAAGQIMRAN